MQSTITGTRFSLTGSGRIIEIPTDEVIQLFEGVSIKATDIAMNEFGLWSLASVGNKGEVKYNSFTTPKHILQARNGCVWNPKLKITQVGGKLITSPYTVNGEICPDAFWDNAFEKIFGTGLDIRNFYATPEGRAVMQTIMGKIFIAMHNGVYDVMYYGDHPLIATSDTNQYYTVEAGEWVDYMDQMAVSEGGGVMTQLDALRDAGNHPHLEGAIVAADFTDDAYVGGTNDVTYYFDQVIKNAHEDLQTIYENNAEDVLILVPPAEYDAYYEQILTTYSEIPAVYVFHITGSDGTTQIAQNILRYKGSWVVRMGGWKRFDRITGYNIHRVVAIARGVFGGAYDVSSLPGQRDVGMRIDQRMGGGEGFMGKIYMLSDFKLGTEILDTNMVAMYSAVDAP